MWKNVNDFLFGFSFGLAFNFVGIFVVFCWLEYANMDTQCEYRRQTQLTGSALSSVLQVLFLFFIIKGVLI